MEFSAYKFQLKINSLFTVYKTIFIMQRFALTKLLAWKESPYRKPLILKGIRQVGKTWLLKEFGKLYYENTAYFNFDENEDLKQFFETTKDVHRIMQNLMLASGTKILPNKTLIIFDEIQDSPKVINSVTSSPTCRGRSFLFDSSNELSSEL